MKTLRLIRLILTAAFIRLGNARRRRQIRRLRRQIDTLHRRSLGLSA